MFGINLSIERNLHLILPKQNSLIQKEAAPGEKKKKGTGFEKLSLYKVPWEMRMGL